MKCVDDLQNSRLFGKASMSVRIVEPVVVYPETLSNHAFASVNSPPQSTYGSMPNINDRIHENTMVIYPEWRVVEGLSFTKMNGKMPVMAVTRKLMTIGVNPESMPLNTATRIDMSMKRALMSNAFPMFVDIAFTVIFLRSVFCTANI